ncbi:MAG: DUF4280 domain-containing protein [Lachnospiraceae bacterium]|nr:DUF4280 domain-containing protein [Lachnospiraceae bacterium]
MDILSWLFKKEDSSAPPEQLVFGAELKCPCGFKHSFLMLQTGSIDINNLPSACVRDSKAFVNIMPFGTCTLGLECEQMIELEDLWENHEPQNMMLGEDEAITMKSTLTCKKSGMWIEPVSSGQDGKAAERILKEAALTCEMKQKYPGLLEILEDPYGSLYLHEGMCEKAIQFLEDSLKRNGDMEMASLYGEYDMEGMLIRSALGHLLVTCDVSRLEVFVEGLSTRGVINGMEDTPGWDARLLNEEMLEMVRREYQETAERIETKSYYKWQEENKRALSFWGQVTMEIAYGCLSYECIIAEKPYLERIERQRAYNANKESVNVNEEVGGEGGGTEGKTTKVTSNTGNEIDITPSSNHSTASKNPGPKGVPNSSVDILDNNGNVSTRRWYDSSGNAYRDVDMTNHGNPKMHSEYPHVHTWDWTDGNPKRSR